MVYFVKKSIMSEPGSDLRNGMPLRNPAVVPGSFLSEMSIRKVASASVGSRLLQIFAKFSEFRDFFSAFRAGATNCPKANASGRKKK